MKTFLKAIMLGPLLGGLLFTNSFAGGYGGQGAKGPVSPHETMEKEAVPAPPHATGAGEAEFYMGALSGVNPERNEIVVNTEVPGLLGPQTRDVPFRLDRDTTLTVCFESLNACEDLASGERRLQILSNFEELESLAMVDKQVIVVGDPESDRIVHVQIDYGF